MSCTINGMRAPLSGTKRKDGRWQIVVTLTTRTGEKKRKTLYADTQREVQDKAQRLLFGTGREAPSEKSVEELFRAAMAGPWSQLRSKTIANYEGDYGRHIAPALGKRKVAKLKPSDIAMWMRGMAEDGKSGRLIQICRNTLSSMLRYAVELGWINSNPCRDLRIPKSAKPKEKPPLTEEEFNKIVQAEEDLVFRRLWLTLGHAGTRPGEALAMSDTDLGYKTDRWWLIVRNAKTEAGEGRWIPIPDNLAHELTSIEGPLFPDQNGQPLHLQNRVHPAWKRVLKKAHISHTNLYQLRKLAISRWVAEALPVDVVQKLAGHTDIRLTMNIYNKVTQTRIAGSFDAMQATLSVSRVCQKDDPEERRNEEE